MQTLQWIASGSEYSGTHEAAGILEGDFTFIRQSLLSITSRSTT
jgi:hypothetical protein